MNIVYAFVGNLPQYAVDTIYQLRLFYDGPVYFIVSDLESPHCLVLREKYNVEIIPYNDIKDDEFNKIINLRYDRFCIVHNLKGREKLFIYSFERFFLLKNLMIKKNLTNVLFLELDNLLYDNPEKWLSAFLEKDMAFMYDNDERFSSGISFIKTYEILTLFNKICLNFISTSNDFLNEMTALSIFYKEYKNQIQILPTHWPIDIYPKECYENYGKYDDSLFDAAALGIYLGGMDPHHTNGIIKYGLKSNWSIIDCTGYKFEWKNDEKNRRIPYVLNKDKWLRINNLHIHSKYLKYCFSIDI